MCELQKNTFFKRHAVVITYSKGSQKLILDFSPTLEHLQPDMPLQQALSLYGQVELVQANIPRYWSIFNKLLNALEKKSPAVEASDLGCAYLGLDGLQSIYPTDDILISSVRKAIPPGFVLQMGIAEGKFMAYIAALRSPAGCYQTVTPADTADFLKDLPCDVLPISLKSKNRLHTFGIYTLAHIAALPPGPLQAQFGPEGKRIRELASGQDTTPLYPRMMKEIIEESSTLPSVTVSLEIILATVESLLSRAFANTALKGKGIRSLTLWTRTCNSEHWERNIRFKEPTMNAGCAVPRIKDILENSQHPGPVEQLGIRITGFGYQSGQQKSLLPEFRNRERLLDCIKQMELHFGSPQLFRIQEVEPWSRIPERRYALIPLSR
jgi:DNA polymerase IV